MFLKFPSTPYIETDTNTKRSDKILQKEEVRGILSQPITIEEKMDGANLGISFNENGELLLQNRGAYLISPFYGQMNCPVFSKNRAMVIWIVKEYIFVRTKEHIWKTGQKWFEKNSNRTS